MGCNPKTKAEAMKMIAKKRAEIARLQAAKSYPYNTKMVKYQINGSIAGLRGQIADLRAKMYSLPK
ncbi:MAG: hypothetical protein ACI30X_05240 [Muribaculaceae bacterium]